MAASKPLLCHVYHLVRLKLAIIDKQTRLSTYLLLSQNNLERQFSLIADIVQASLETRPLVDLQTVRALNAAAMTCLTEQPGRFRYEEVSIIGSCHEPPRPQEVKDLTVEMMDHINKAWTSENTYLLAAYALWRLVWIHPFEDGNGRTARALSYLIICIRESALLTGTKSYAELIKEHRQAYIDNIRHADRTFLAGKLDLIPLAEFLAEIVTKQLRSEQT